VIELQVNGRPVRLDAETPLLSYLAQIGVEPRSVAVELNGEILERARFPEVELRSGDAVEIVRMVGGGSGPS
jgi:sulfur carrier protein